MGMLPERQLKIVISGGTSQIGVLLARHFHSQGHLVSTLSRFPKPQAWQAVHWDGETMGDWAVSFEASDVVISCATRSKRANQLVSQAIAACTRPPRVWLKASVPEPIEFLQASAGTRRVTMVLGSVMSLSLGVFPKLLWLARCGFTEVHGRDEEARVDWIHETDFLRGLEFLMEDDRMDGRVNLASPAAVSRRELLLGIREAWPYHLASLPAPDWLLRLVLPELVLRERHGEERSLQSAGFVFEYSDWPGAAEDLVGRRQWRQG